jgi:hypothetical protein
MNISSSFSEGAGGIYGGGRSPSRNIQCNICTNLLTFINANNHEIIKPLTLLSWVLAIQNSSCIFYPFKTFPLSKQTRQESYT